MLRSKIVADGVLQKTDTIGQYLRLFETSDADPDPHQWGRNTVKSEWKAVLRIRMDPEPRSEIQWKEIITGIQDTDHI